MVRIEIISETMEEAMAQVRTMQVALSDSPQAPEAIESPDVNTTEEEPNVETKSEPEADPPKPARNTRTRNRKKTEPKEAEAPAPAEETDVAAGEDEQPAPMKLEDVRAALNDAIKAGVNVSKIIHQYGECLSKIPASNYPAIVADAKTAMEEKK